MKKTLVAIAALIVAGIGACTVTRTTSVTPHQQTVNEPARLVALYRRLLDNDCDAKQLAFNFCATQHNLVGILERSMTITNVDALDAHLNTLAPSDTRTELSSVILDLRKAMTR